MTETTETFPVICVQPDEDSDEHIHGAAEGSANRDPYKQQEDEHKPDGCRQLLQEEQQPALSIKHVTPTEKQQHVTSNQDIIEGNHMYAAGDRTRYSFHPSIVKTEPVVDGHLDSNIIGGSKHHVNREVEPTQRISWVPRIICRQSEVKSEASVDTGSITAIWVAQPATQDEQQPSIHHMEHDMKSEEGLVISSYCSLAQNTECKVEYSVMDGDHIDVKVENTEVKKAFVNKSLKLESIDASEQLAKASTSQEHVETNMMDVDSKDNSTQNMHINEHSGRPRKKAKHKCRVCEKCFQRPSELKRHMRIHTGTKPYQCPVCDKHFNRKNNVTIHMRIHSGKRPYKCAVCEKYFTTNSDLTIHMRIHSGVRPYKCLVCDKCFAQSSHLTVHMRVHSGDKPYQCTVCEKSFADSGGLKKHIRIHINERPYECSVCGKSFADSGNLTKHIRIHTSEKPYECSVCEKSFAQSSDLIKHKRQHSGEKPYECTVCWKRFARSDHLTIHKRKHTGIKPFECSVCGKRFARSDHLKSHQKQHRK